MSDPAKIFLEKMEHASEPDALGLRQLKYSLRGTKMNELVGRSIEIRFTGRIQCVKCGRAIKKTFGDGFCFPCSQKLACCDLCILKPELCHFRHGTCREPDWAKQNCLIDHVVYLCNTTGLKVGITRGFKKFERWGDQGALSATVLAVVPERYVAGLLEVALSKHLADKSDWRALIRGQTCEVDLMKERERVRELVEDQFKSYLVSGGEFDLIHRFAYPVLKYPEKAQTFNLDKEPLVSGELQGIRGQYLFIAGKALNVRKYIGYEVEIKLPS